MSIKNVDLKDHLTIEDAKKNMSEALHNGSEEDQREAFLDVQQAIADDVRKRAEAEIGRVNEAYQDEQILAKRGTRKALTSEEKRYFNAVVEKKGWKDIPEMIPETIVEDVLDRISTEHPILSLVDMRSTSALVKYVMAKPTAARGFWGDICDDIKQIILDGFKIDQFQTYKLSGFVVMCKGMLELGPSWVATWITESLYEIISATLEEAIVSGDGDKKPIGMRMKLTGAIDGVHAEKQKTALTELNGGSLAGFHAALAKKKLDDGQVSVLVNPTTYWTKVFPALLTKDVYGRDVIYNQFASGEKVVQSYAVPENEMIVGSLKNYFLAVAGQMRIEEYKETLAIEDLDLYIAKMFAYGQPKDPNAFLIADVSGVKAAVTPAIEEEEADEEDPELP